jgi:hypothetical protein
VVAGLEIFESEAKALQAPTDLDTTLERIKRTILPDGIYIHVLNSEAQKTAGRGLGSVALPVQGVQRVDQSPDLTQIRYYATPQNVRTADARWTLWT